MNPANNLLMFKKELWIKDYSLRMQRWLNGEILPPVRIEAEPHRRCNLNCLHCIRKHSNEDMNEESKRIEVDEKRWLEIAKESGRMGVKLWNIAGVGEPMMKASFTLKLMRTIKKYGMFGELTTNGTLLEDEHIRSIIKMGWDSINVSIDGKDAQTHDNIRQVKGVFKKVTETIQRLNIYREKQDQKVPCITLNMVLNKLNYNQLPDMVRLTKDLGADAIFVEPMIVYHETGKRLMMDNKQVKQMRSIIQKTEELAKELDVFTFISCIESEEEKKKFNKELIRKTSNIRNVIVSNSKKATKKEMIPFLSRPHYSNTIKKILSIPCYHPWFYLTISADGSVTHCGECKGSNANIQNMSLSDIWLSKHMQKTRASFFDENLPQYCNKCRPNVIGDIRIVRKSIREYADINILQDTLINIMRENTALKDGEPITEKPKSRVGLIKESLKKMIKHYGSKNNQFEPLD